MATFCERAAFSINHMFSLYFDYAILVISHFGFEVGTLVLVAPIPGLCLLYSRVTFYFLIMVFV